MARSSFINGCTYQFKNNGQLVRVKVVGYDPIDKVHIVTHNGRESRLNLKAMNARLTSRRCASKKSSTKDVYLYVCDLGSGQYKFGATSNPKNRAQQIKTYSSRAKMISLTKLPAHKGSQWHSLESTVLRRFAGHRSGDGGREVFKLNANKLGEMVNFARHVVHHEA